LYVLLAKWATDFAPSRKVVAEAPYFCPIIVLLGKLFDVAHVKAKSKPLERDWSPLGPSTLDFIKKPQVMVVDG